MYITIIKRLHYFIWCTFAFWDLQNKHKSVKNKDQKGECNSLNTDFQIFPIQHVGYFQWEIGTNINLCTGDYNL